MKLKTVPTRTYEIPPTFPKNAKIFVTALDHCPSLVYAVNSTVIIILASLLYLYLLKTN